MNFDSWVAAKFSFRYVGPHSNGEFVIKAVDWVGAEFTLQCSMDGVPNQRHRWHPSGMTEPQQQAFKRALAEFVRQCDAPELAKARAEAAAVRAQHLRASFLASANALLCGGMPAAEVRALLDEYLVEHVMGS